jgi:hypothetical protein
MSLKEFSLTQALTCISDLDCDVQLLITNLPIQIQHVV